MNFQHQQFSASIPLSWTEATAFAEVLHFLDSVHSLPCWLKWAACSLFNAEEKWNDALKPSTLAESCSSPSFNVLDFSEAVHAEKAGMSNVFVHMNPSLFHLVIEVQECVCVYVGGLRRCLRGEEMCGFKGGKRKCILTSPSQISVSASVMELMEQMLRAPSCRGGDLWRGRHA